MSYYSGEQEYITWLESIVNAFLNANKLEELKALYGGQFCAVIVEMMSCSRDTELVMKCWEILDRQGRITVKTMLNQYAELFKSSREIIIPLLEDVKEFTLVENSESVQDNDIGDDAISLHAMIYSIVCGDK